MQKEEAAKALEEAGMHEEAGEAYVVIGEFAQLINDSTSAANAFVHAIRNFEMAEKHKKVASASAEAGAAHAKMGEFWPAGLYYEKAWKLYTTEGMREKGISALKDSIDAFKKGVRRYEHKVAGWSMYGTYLSCLQKVKQLESKQE